MASLMAIPEELRDEIIELVLLHERQPSTDIGTAKQNRRIIDNLERRSDEDFERGRIEGKTLCWVYGTDNVFYETSPTISNASGLLLANKHLHHQTKRGLSRLFPNGQSYKLDVLFADESTLIPTWLRVPMFSRNLNAVNVTVRILGRNTTTVRGAFVDGSMAPTRVVWLFYWLLEHFLLYNVTKPTSSEAETGLRDRKKLPTTVQTINLNFVSGEPALLSEDTKEQQHRWWQRQWLMREEGDGIRIRTDEELVRDGEPVRLHPRWLADTIGSNVQTLTWMTDKYSPYGTILYGRVGSIKVFADEQLVHEVVVPDRRPARWLD